ncbi:MAG TPA: hypothetical protein VGA86_11240 [Desulfatiglandales bacterium]
MKKGKEKDTMREEYDFTGGIRGKYAKRFSDGSNIIVLDPDVAKLFPDSKTVNEVLRSIAKIAQQKVKKVAG